MQIINEQDWQSLPELAQQEVYDFFLFIKQRYGQTDNNETIALSNYSANTVQEWLNEQENAVRK